MNCPSVNVSRNFLCVHNYFSFNQFNEDPYPINGIEFL